MWLLTRSRSWICRSISLSRQPRVRCAGEACPLRRRSRWHLGGANVAVAEVRGLLRSLYVVVLERREAVLGKGRHPGVIGRLHLNLVKPGCVASEDQLLGGAIGVAERRKAVLLLHVLRDFEAAQRFHLPLRRPVPDRVSPPHPLLYPHHLHPRPPPH